MNYVPPFQSILGQIIGYVALLHINQHRKPFSLRAPLLAYVGHVPPSQTSLSKFFSGMLYTSCVVQWVEDIVKNEGLCIQSLLHEIEIIYKIIIFL